MEAQQILDQYSTQLGKRQAENIGKALADLFNHSFRVVPSGENLGMAISGWVSGSGAYKKFKEYTKAEFSKIGSRPVVKEILSGLTKLNKEQIQERIAEHLAIV